MHNKQCLRCILDTSYPNITFDSKGICNFCRSFEHHVRKFPINEKSETKISNILNKIRERNRNKDYDCIVGFSGGRDSSYVLYCLKEKWKMRPLAFHCDIHMNSHIAVSNIKKMCNALDVDLITEVVDWGEFADLQRSFFRASVPAIDTPQDHAIFTTLNRAAEREQIKTIITGSSIRTEGPIPYQWSWVHDPLFILDIHRKFGKNSLKKFPIRTYGEIIRQRITNFVIITPLNFIPYDNHFVDPFLSENFGWKQYGGHHHESILTRWLFAYYLPVKFHIDSRNTDLSVHVRSGMITREQAIKLMESDHYPSHQEHEDRRYIMNKFGFSEEEFEIILSSKPMRNFDYRHAPVYAQKSMNYLLGPKKLFY